MLSLPDPAHARDKWLTFPELIKLIRKAENCNGRRAQKQIRALLAYGELAPLRWENPPPFPTPVGTPEPLQEGWPPTGHKRWASVKINWRTGAVLDDFDLTQEALAAGAATWRRLFVYRAAWEGRELVRARAEQDFQSPHWSLGNVLSWIAFRDPALICRFENLRNLLAYRLVYDYPRRPMLDPNADRTLLDALKDEDNPLMAIGHGTIIPQEDWLCRTTRNLSADLRFRRAAALRRWPIDSSDSTPSAHPIAPEPASRDGKSSLTTTQLRKRRGPVLGTVRRYEASDRELFPEIERLMKNNRISLSDASLRLAREEVEGKKVEGTGTPESRAKRLGSLYRAERPNPIKTP